MKVLIISSFLPFPLHSGGHVRLYNLIKEISKTNEVTLICEKRSHQTNTDIDEVRKICKEVITIDRKRQWSPKVIIQTAISSLPFLLVGHRLPQMRQEIVKVLKDKKFDVIHVETFYVYQNLPKTYLPTVVVEHNIEYEVYEKFMKRSPAFVRPLLSVDIHKIKYWEEKVWRQATKVVAVSEKDKAKIKRKDVVVVPNGVNLEEFKMQTKKDKKEKVVLFMGDFKWIQNVDSAKYIVKEIWPKLENILNSQKVKLDIKLWIVGKNIPENLKKYGSDNILFDENAPDKTSDIYKKADVLLAPIQVGGGTSYKIIESMASGVPVVTTLLGVEGLGAKKDVDALVADSAEQHAKNIVKLLEDKVLYEKLRKNARAFIEKNFSWVKIAQILEKVYKEALEVNE
ncbi:MAG TPA: glycosyltransferase family 4 protein [Patescibacteria group bacterium]